MTKFVNEYVATCDTCNRTKSSSAKPHGLLKPNEIPNAPWKIITSDFIVKLSMSEGHDSILVTADRLTKQVHLSGTVETCDAEGCGDIYV